MVQQAFSTELAAEPDISQIITEDDTPVDNFLSEKQQRLLTEVLYNAWLPPTESQTFIAAANVGVFYNIGLPPLVPDVFLSLDVTMPENWGEKKNRSYFNWQFGKAPDVVIEIVSNREGNELGSKLKDYARMGVWYYAIFDPLGMLGDQLLRIYQLGIRQYLETDDFYFPEVGLGLTLWEGVFEGKQDIWLRWCDKAGNILPTGTESAQQAQQEAQTAKQEAQTAKQEAQTAKQEAELAQQRTAQLEAQLRALGIEPQGNS
ncbi:Uma2 family endonuclease [Anabaena catenula]|uniref:Uma2 family endonuclease n=1 Tax=Anabaena catenula FACHB-362 TaxID=2692877 RepID=A0ABR8J038_9NOST|nr:Uma2 family endonuclease [Anabaena catenula]MBD2691712.1 Uma2 family endonuclease [Anabaena catenula FACHB-362]